MSAIVAVLAVILTGAVASPASANSGWRCKNLGNGELCFQTYRFDVAHISGADISYRKWGGGCITARFGHRIYGYNFSAQWMDSGPFTMCPNTLPRSYYWYHGGIGAYVPPDTVVVGFMDVLSQGTFYSPVVPRAEI
jgi:hypothetical protein